MNSRERVRSVLAHRLPDRVPNGLGGCETAGMHIVVYDKLQKVLGKGGNYLFAGVHNLSAEMPEHHIKAMIDAYFDARQYD